MARAIRVALLSLLLALGVSVGESAVSSLRAEDNGASAEKQRITAAICALQIDQICTEACKGEKTEKECPQQCRSIVGNSCPEKRRSAKSEEAQQKGAFSDLICGLVTQTVCGIACSGTGVERECHRECENIVVDACNYR